MISPIAGDAAFEYGIYFLKLLVTAVAVSSVEVDKYMIGRTHDHVFSQSSQLSRALDRWNPQMLPPTERKDFIFNDLFMLLHILVRVSFDMLVLVACSLAVIATRLNFLIITTSIVIAISFLVFYFT